MPLQKEEKRSQSLPPHIYTLRNGQINPQGEGGACKPGGQLLLEPKRAGTLSRTSSLQNYEKIDFLLLKQPKQTTTARVFVFLQIHALKPHRQWDGMRRWKLLMGEALYEPAVRALMKRSEKDPWLPFCCEVTASMRKQTLTRERPLPQSWTFQPPELRNKCLLFLSHPVYLVLLQKPRLRHSAKSHLFHSLCSSRMSCLSSAFLSVTDKEDVDYLKWIALSTK